MNKPAALYARVSSDRQKENHTIGSQVAALTQYAETNGYVVPPEWQFQDDGYSGTTLVRPGLEALRDLAAEGQIQTVLIYSPDRLSRKYAYQVLLAEELARCGVELIFLRAPSGTTAEDQLLVQFQGMIAEYERAQIAERSRRGKRHRAHQGSISVLSGAPYGYRYVKKTDTSAAYYEVVESEAEVVHLIFDAYTRQGLSIGAIASLLNQREVPTRTQHSRWERPTIWRMLHNPAYEGRAFYGKTELRPRQRITRRLRQRGLPSRDSAFRERPRQEWIEIPVPALVSEATFALAQEQAEKNKRFSPRRTLEASLLQGMLVCQRCGYGLYRTSTRTSTRTIYYYRCLGRDGYRHLKGAVCDNVPIRQDQLDAVVWQEILRLLEDPGLLQTEVDRRLQAARTTDPLRQREDALRRDQARLAKSMERPDWVSGKPDHARGAPLPRAGTPQAAAGDRGRIAVAGDGCCRSNPASTPGGNSRRAPRTTARQRQRPGSSRASENCATVGTRDPRGQGQHHDPPLNSNADFSPRLERRRSAKPETA
jgi:site-specific DNA recombinase